MENQNLKKPSDSQNASPSVNRSRRSFAKAGAIAPVIMSLGSKTALGAPLPYHCTLSGQLSGNTSPHHDNTTPCPPGKNAAYWATTNPASLSSSVAGTPLHQIGFAGAPNNASLIKVVDGSVSVSTLLKCAVLDYLNISYPQQSGLAIPGITGSDIVNLYNIAVGSPGILPAKLQNVSIAHATSFLQAICPQ